MTQKNNEELYSILLLGDTAVGKTCFLIRFNENDFQEAHLSTMGVDFKLKQMILKNGTKITAKIWDTAGQERFKALTKNYYKQAHGIILMYDVTSNNSFNNMDRWMEQIKDKAPPHIQTIIVGNKCDLESERKISTQTGQEFANKYNVSFFETSVKENLNVKETFQAIVEKISVVVENNKEKNQTLQSEKPKKKKTCC